MILACSDMPLEIIVVDKNCWFRRRARRLPVAHRLALPLGLEAARLGIEFNYARRVHHFVENHDVVFGLHQLHIVIVRARNHGRATDKARGGSDRPWFGLGACAVEYHVAVVGAALFADGIELRNAAIGWIVDKRSAPACDGLAAALIPKFVIGNDARR